MCILKYVEEGKREKKKKKQQQKGTLCHFPGLIGNFGHFERYILKGFNQARYELTEVFTSHFGQQERIRRHRSHCCGCCLQRVHPGCEFVCCVPRLGGMMLQILQAGGQFR
jgi:hypothetical protein